jgi:predicted AAA+ superfamily ATPase
MEGVSESLAGRMAIHTLLGVSLREICNDDFNDVFLPTSDYLEKRGDSVLKTWNPATVWEIILRGSMPELVANQDIPTSSYYGSYINTYLERDVRSLAQVGDLRLFNNFMIALAARTGQMLNMSDVASDVGISVPTVKRWLSVLEASNIIYLLRPYYTNISKRVIKTPKLYFLDTGLAAHLTGWTTPDVMRLGAMAGAFFETFVVTEILKSFYNKGVVEPPLYYYRDQQKNEIDILIVRDGKIHPIEIKANANPQTNDIKAFAKLEQFIGSGVTRGEGALICLYDRILPLSDNDRIIPLGYL